MKTGLKNKLLWLDDIRDPRDPKWAIPNADPVWVKSHFEFITWIEENGLPDIISFDHDLGDGASGYDCAKDLVEYCFRFNKPLPEFRCHSANPVGRENILGLLNNFKKHF